MGYLKSDKLSEECAVFGISGSGGEAGGYVYNGLISLQHRGQEGAGIATLVGVSIETHKGEGLVSDVFKDGLDMLRGSDLAIGHARYLATARKNKKSAIQPFVKEYLTGRLAVAYNGVLTNGSKIKSALSKKGITFTSDSDSETISSLIAYKIIKQKNVENGIIEAVKLLEGAFSLVIMSSQKKLFAVRDASGFRPLCIGGDFRTTAVSSESCALESCGLKFERDVVPGELVIIEDGKVTQSIFYKCDDEPKKTSLCVFEYVYFARPDSVIDGLSVYEARFNMGATLAKEWPCIADVVCGVPDSGLEAALGYSYQSSIPLVTGFIKNRYVGRSFIYPSQSQREHVVRIKLNPLTANVKGKKVVLVDDSIVRGTTCARIISALRDAGAKEVHMRVSSPPFVYTCHHGTDIGDEKNLIANKLSLEQIRVKIGADSLGYISLSGLKIACEGCKLNFCTYCFEKKD